MGPSIVGYAGKADTRWRCKLCWAYLPDLARAFVAIAEASWLADFERLHFAGHTLTGAELLRADGIVVPMWREIAEMAYLWQVPHALDGNRLRQTVGELPGTPIDDPLGRALVELGLIEAPPRA